MKLALVILLASTCHAELVKIEAPSLVPIRDAADAIGAHLASVLRDGLVDIEVDAQVHPGAVVATLTINVESGAVVVNIPVDDAVEILLPWLRQEAQMIRDDLRTSAGRDSHELVKAIRFGIAAICVLFGVAIVVRGVDRFADNKRADRRQEP